MFRVVHKTRSKAGFPRGGVRLPKQQLTGKVVDPEMEVLVVLRLVLKPNAVWPVRFQ